MELQGKVAVVTGGASGIGRALCQRFAAAGARAVVVADLDAPGAEAVAADLSRHGTRGIPVRADVSLPPDIAAMVEVAEREGGPIDLLCCNAGIAIGGGPETPDEDWQRIWEVNVMAHVRAVRAVLPAMLDRGHGYLLHTASAAGLLTNLGAAPYTVTKHAVVALAEWLSVTYADAGIKVSCLCPQGVNTPMLRDALASQGIAGAAVRAAGDVLEPEQVAEATVAGLRDERFLILPHPQVADLMVRRAAQMGPWLDSLRRLQARLSGAGS